MIKRHNHFKIGINDPELLHYRSGKSKSIFVNVQILACNHLKLLYLNHVSVLIAYLKVTGVVSCCQAGKFYLENEPVLR